jgi:hypothetical protein
MVRGLPYPGSVRSAGRPTHPFRVVAVLALAAVLGACGRSDDDVAADRVVGSTTASAPQAAPTTTTSTQPPPTVARPGPPAAGMCGVVVDDAAPPVGATVTVTVRSAVAGAPFLARVAGGATGSAGSGTLDGSGTGTVRLPVPAPQGGLPVQVEISVAGGAETCSVGVMPR